MDLKSGYHQIEMEESDEPKTAFALWDLKSNAARNSNGTIRIPARNGEVRGRHAPARSARFPWWFDLLFKILGGTRSLIGAAFSEPQCATRGILCQEKVKAIKTWPRPQTLKELKSFLGYSGYYRRFVRDYTKNVKLLISLTLGFLPSRKGTKVIKIHAKYCNLKEQFGEKWRQTCEMSFEEIMGKLASSPALGFTYPQLPYVLHTDAITTGLGATSWGESYYCLCK